MLHLLELADAHKHVGRVRLVLHCPRREEVRRGGLRQRHRQRRVLRQLGEELQLRLELRRRLP